MKRLTILFSLLFILQIINAKEVDPETAKLVAQNHYQQVNKSKGSLNLELVYTNKSKIISNLNKSGSNDIPLFYVFNADNNNGFVIVSGDDNLTPILGYSTSNNYSEINIPPAFKKLLEKYKKEITYIISNKLKANDEIKSKWKRLKNGQSLNSNKDINEVSPLLSTTWNQNPYYNDLCPGGSVTGCAATAMAQIMKYWNYPTTGTGFHSYNHVTYGTLSANFAATTYNWSAMPTNLTSSNNSVALLMYHCGVAIEMNYSPQISGAWVIEYNSPICVESALKTYFGFQPTMQGLLRENYSDNDWIQLLKDDLDASHPIQYVGWGPGMQGGHTFVCDGYDSNDFFHMNWGWGGQGNAFLILNSLNPTSTGTGAGLGDYNYGQQALIGIQPPSSSIYYNMSLYDNLTATPNPIYYGQEFTVHSDIANWGTTTFNGDYCAAIFDDSYNFVEYVEILSGYSLGGGQHYTSGLDFTNSGMLTVLPGSYCIGIFYRPTGGNWIMVSDGSYSNMISFDVYYSNDIELYQDMIIDCGTNISQNQAFTVTLDIVNDDSSTFNGEFDVSLYNLDGSFAETIQTLTGVSLGAGYFYDDLEFVTSGVSVTPGTYLLALMHKEDGGNWELTGSTYYTNPIKVIIQKAVINPDMYESNDIQNDAYNLTVNFSGSNASVETTGSNLHVGSDYDYYKIVLASGYDYTITARVHDSYNSGNGQTYTNDVLWSYLNGSTWSDAYDDVMSGNITVNNGGTVIFNVAPYFSGETGTYLLDIDVSRTATGIEDVATSEYISVFPNPATDIINIEIENNTQVNNVKIVDMVGKQVLQIDISTFNDKHIVIPIKELPYGTYMLLIQTDETIWQHKFIKSE